MAWSNRDRHGLEGEFPELAVSVVVSLRIEFSVEGQRGGASDWITRGGLTVVGGTLEMWCEESRKFLSPDVVLLFPFGFNLGISTLRARLVCT